MMDKQLNTHYKEKPQLEMLYHLDIFLQPSDQTFKSPSWTRYCRIFFSSSFLKIIYVFIFKSNQNLNTGPFGSRILLLPNSFLVAPGFECKIKMHMLT